MDHTAQDITEGVAVIGMACRFPGASDLRAFRDLLSSGKEGIRRFDSEELSRAGVSDIERNDPNYVNVRPIIDDAACFDHDFFGFNPVSARLMDPQHRIMLQTAWHAFEDAGYIPGDEKGVTGVYCASTMSSWLMRYIMGNEDIRENHDMTEIMVLNDQDHIATRLAYLLNLKGPAVSLGSSCSSSLVAVEHAFRSLLNYQTDLALAGGVSIQMPQERGYLHREGGIQSSDGHCRAFDAKSDGTFFGNGCGVVLLKRLEDALEDGDSIYAVIRGAAANNDGADKVGYTAPSITGQQNVIQDALELSGIDQQQLAFIEAHGTGTKMGDPIEIRALTRAYNQLNTRPGSVAIGSVKTNIGHLESASGIAGFIKACLGLQHREIYPSLHFSQPNPEIDFDASPFYVATEYSNWQEPGQRCAGVSSFGMGGTNVHVVLQEGPVLNSKPAVEVSPAELILLSAKSNTALEELEKKISNRLTTMEEDTLPGYARTSVEGRASFSVRKVAAVEKEGRTVLWAEPLAINKQEDTEAAFLFPGQSAQYPGMARQLYQRFSDFRHVFDRGADWIEQKGKYDIKALLFENTNPQEIHQTQYSQLSLFLVEYSLSHLLNELGIAPELVAGHSLGEITAACTAGVMDFETGLELVYQRGRFMQQAPAGSMLSVKASKQEIKPLLKGGLCISVYNALDRLAISGTPEEIENLISRCDEAGIACHMLHTSHAFHHESMKEAAGRFGEAIASLKFHAPQKPVYSNIDGALYDPEEPITPEYWVRQILHPVRFDRIADQWLTSKNVLIHEVGPGAMLGALLQMHPNYGHGAEAISYMPRPKEVDKELLHFLQQLGSLWIAGHTLNWNAYYRGYSVCKGIFENYPFEKNQHLLPLSESGGKSEIVHSTEISVSETTNRISPKVMSNEEHQHVIYQKLFDKIIQISGRPSGELQADTHFLEFGLDSLTLVSINQFIKKTFGVKIPFRKLQDQYATLDTLSDYLASKTDPPKEEMLQPAKPMSVENSKVNGIHQHGGGATDSRSTKERIINEQLDIMRRQLEVLDGRPPEITTNGRNKASKVSTDFLLGPLSNQVPKNAVPSGGLNRDHHPDDLQQLLHEYLPKTRTSREHTQRYRKSLADSRMMQGYRQAWKELVYPPVLKRAEGSRVWDIDDNEYIDFVSGFGALLLGHNPDFLQEAIYEELRQNSPQLSVHHDQAGPTAELVADITGHERVTFCNTGSEAVMTAMRLARLETGKDMIVFFENDYHGNFDEVLGHAHRDNDTISTRPFVGGVPGHSMQNVILLPYNHPESLQWIELHHEKIAGVMVEPVQSRHPEIQPKAFLHDLRQLCDSKDMAFIIDEVVTGFRLAPGGAQQYFGVKADLATYGKIAANGMPIGIVAGDSRFLDGIDGGYWQYGDDSFPEHDQTFIGGTFRKHPLSLAAVRAVLHYINENKDTLYAELKAKADRLSRKVRLLIDQHAWPLRFNICESMFYLQPLEGCPPFELLNFELLNHGIYVFGERPYYLSQAHSDEDIDSFVDALEQSMQKLLNGKTSGHQKKDSDSAGGYSLTGAQKEIWLNTIHGSEASSAYNMVTHLRFDDTLNRSAFAKAFQFLLNRHDAFSLRFSEDGSRQFTGAAAADIIVKDMDEMGDAVELTAYIKSFRNEPFDLTSGPLYRAELVQAPNNQWHFLFCVHHIIFDGWSSDVFIHELSELYSKGCEQQSLTLDEPAGNYIEYVEDKACQAVDSETSEFWKRTLEDPPSPLQWQAIKQRPPVRTFKAGRRTCLISADLVGDLQQVARSQRVSLNTVLVAAYALWLNRLSANKDIVVGLPVASQPQSGHERLVGHCTNMLPVRISIDADETIADLFSRLHRQIQEIMEHGSIGYGEILKLCKIPALPDRSPLIQTTFNLDNVLTRPTFKDTQVEFIPENRSYSPFELAFDIQETSEGLFIQCDYLTSLFEPEQIDQWLEYFDYILNQLSRSDDLYAKDVQLLVPEEQVRLLALGQPSEEVHTDKKSTLISCFRRMVKKNPRREAVRLRDETLTYKELDQRSDALAIALNEQDIKKGDIVGLCLDRDPSLIVGIVGILKTGACYVPIDPVYPEERRRFITEDSGADCIITNDNYVKSWANTKIPMLSISALPASVPQNKKANFAMPMAEDRAYIIYTSGSTGKPKGVEISHHNVVRLFEATDSLFKFDKNDRWTLFHSYAFDFSVWEIWGALLYGGSLTIVPQWITRSPDALYQLLSEQKITVLNQTPSAFKMLASHEQFLESDQRLSLSLRYIIFGGEKLEFDILRPWTNIHGLEKPQLINMYGITETSVHATYHPITEPDLDQPDSLIGKPLPDLEIFLLDENGRPVPEGFAGEICIAGDGLAKGYLNREELNKEKFQDADLSIGTRRVYRSGDLACWSSDGSLVYLHRKDHQIKIRGHRVEIGEITQHIRACDGVEDAFVKVIETGETPSLAAFMVLDDQGKAAPITMDAIKTTMQKQLPSYMIPAHWVPVDSLPLNSNGKIAVEKLPDVGNAREQLSNYEEPIGPAEQSIAQIWAEVLDCKKVSRHDNYFELGGDSVTSIRITQRLRKKGWSCSYKQIFEYPSVARLAAALNEQENNEDLLPAQKLNGKQNAVPELYGIQRWFFDHFDSPEWYHQLATLSFDELPETEQLLDALNKVVNRHQALQTGYEQKEGRWAPRHVQQPLVTVYTAGSDEDPKDILSQALSKTDLASCGLVQAIRDMQHQKVYVAIHHLAVDALSWPVLLDDLDKVLEGQLMPKNQGPDLYQWVADFHKQIDSNSLDDSLRYWSGSSWKKAAVPFCRNGKADKNKAEYRHISKQLDVVAQSPGTDLYPALLGALAMAVESHIKKDAFVIDIEHHGRGSYFNLPSPEGMVGWFTSICPLLLKKPKQGWEDTKSIYRQVKKVPQNGRFFEYLRGHEDITAPHSCGMLFNYLGKGQASYKKKHFSAAPAKNVEEVNPRVMRPHPVEINIQQNTKSFQLDLHYDSGIIKEKDITAFMEQFSHQIQQMGSTAAQEEVAYDMDEILAEIEIDAHNSI